MRTRLLWCLASSTQHGLACLALLLCLPAFVVEGAGQQAADSQTATLRIYLARHGQTAWNLEGRTQGGTDTPLNATGREQANVLRERTKDIHFDAVYSSLLSRSRETADIVRGQVPLTSLGSLGERRSGKFEGLLTSDPNTGPEFERRQWDLNDDLDGGESLTAFTNRVRTAVEAIRQRHVSGTILVVGHSGTNRAILGILMGLDVEQTKAIGQGNDELYLIEVESGRAPHLWKFITTSNLTDL